MRIRCELCKREIDVEDMGSFELYLHALHLNVVHNYPDNFDLKSDGDGRWLVNGKVVLVDANRHSV